MAFGIILPLATIKIRLQNTFHQQLTSTSGNGTTLMQPRRRGFRFAREKFWNNKVAPGGNQPGRKVFCPQRPDLIDG
jgi:hypothetical protein